MKELKLVGGYGSPYSRKMRAVLRYRRIPFQWIMRDSRWDVGIPPVPVALIPVLVFPGESGAPDTAMVDSTFQILKLESMFAERSLIPSDPALAFLQSVIEDYADEWLTKPMFHYRWTYAPDISKAASVLPLDRDVNVPPDKVERMARFISERQIARLGVVGSNKTTLPIIEASYRRLLKILDAHLTAHPFLMGDRPGAGDFGLFGQLSQLAHFDPTPSAIAADEAPRVVSWVSWIDDLSWLAVGEGDGWIGRDAVGSTLRAFFEEIGRVYSPFLIANARALAAGKPQVECVIDGSKWVQRPFPYQAKCLKWLREGYAALSESDRYFVDDLLKGTGCEAIFEG